MLCESQEATESAEDWWCLPQARATVTEPLQDLLFQPPEGSSGPSEAQVRQLFAFSLDNARLNDPRMSLRSSFDRIP